MMVMGTSSKCLNLRKVWGKEGSSAPYGTVSQKAQAASGSKDSLVRVGAMLIGRGIVSWDGERSGRRT